MASLCPSRRGHLALLRRVFLCREEVEKGHTTEAERKQGGQRLGSPHRFGMEDVTGMGCLKEVYLSDKVDQWMAMVSCETSCLVPAP